MWRSNNMLLKTNGPKKKSREKENKYFETTENGKKTAKCVGYSKSSSKREVHLDTRLHQETRVRSNKLTLQLTELQKEQRNPSYQKKGNSKNQTEKK